MNARMCMDGSTLGVCRTTWLATESLVPGFNFSQLLLCVFIGAQHLLRRPHLPLLIFINIYNQFIASHCIDFFILCGLCFYKINIITQETSFTNFFQTLVWFFLLISHLNPLNLLAWLTLCVLAASAGNPELVDQLERPRSDRLRRAGSGGDVSSAASQERAHPLPV